MRAGTSGSRGGAWSAARATASPTPGSACTGRSSSTAAPRRGYRCCRFWSAPSPQAWCVGTCIAASGAMSVPQSAWRAWMHACVRYNEPMSDLKGGPVVAEGARVYSGEKYLTTQGFTAIRDGGAAHYAACVRAIKRRNPHTAVEALTPDFRGVRADVETVVHSGIEVFAQNIETVRRLTHPVRDPRAGYQQTLQVLAAAKRRRPAVLTKSSLMLGLGERDEEIDATLADLRAAGVDLVTLGQYLRPTLNHLPVQRFVTPEEFDRYRELALGRGFLECVSGPLVRSSYRAEQALKRNNAGLDNRRLAT